MEYTAFEIIGPVMVGPSSSHTAGACKIGNIARKICEDGFESVDFFLHGSFAYTYQGHGTDRALVGGIMGYETDDARIENSFEYAKKNGIDFTFHETNLGEEFHPNTVKIVFHYKDRDEYIIGSSIGGGAIMIVDINGIDIEFRGVFPTLLLEYPEQSGVIAFVSTELSKRDYNIETMITNKNSLTGIVTLTVEVETALCEDVKKVILDDKRFITAKYVEV